MLIPLFPLEAILFSKGFIKLRIFEFRYLDMVAECIRNDTGFGICLNNPDDEAQPFHSVGCYVKIVDWIAWKMEVLESQQRESVNFGCNLLTLVQII